MKNLIYSVYPRANNIEWMLNVLELKKYYDTFDGKKIIIVREDSSTTVSDVEYWYNLFPKSEIRFVHNNPVLGETLGFLDAIDTILHYDYTGYTFYAHTKGVTHTEKDKIKAIRIWRNNMYHACLNIMHFNNVSCLGAYGINIKSPLYPQALWSYVGNFWWVKNAKLIDSDWNKITLDKYGVEGYLGSILPWSEAVCILDDHCDKDFYSLEDKRQENLPPRNTRKVFTCSVCKYSHILNILCPKCSILMKESNA